MRAGPLRGQSARGAGALAALAAACAAAPRGGAPPTAHYLRFPAADSLAAFLDPRTGAGPLVSAHRGGPAPGYPDNALETFERTLGFGPMLIELDVRRSADGQLAVLHDDEVSRTTTGRGRVGTIRLDSLRRLRLRDATSATTPFRVPSLQEALAWADGRAVLRLDVKEGVTPDLVVDEVRRAGGVGRVMVGARDAADARRYHALQPGLVVSFWYDPDRDGRLSLVEVRSLLALPLDRRHVVVGVGSTRDGWDAAVLDTLRAHGVRGMVSTFGEVDRAAAARGEWRLYCPLVAARVGVIITDAPAEAARAVRSCPAAPSSLPAPASPTPR